MKAQRHTGLSESQSAARSDSANDLIDFWKVPESARSMMRNCGGVTCVGLSGSFPEIQPASRRKPELVRVAGEDVSLFADVAAAEIGNDWKPFLSGDNGLPLAWRDGKGTSFVFPFNVQDAIDGMLTERYAATWVGDRASKAARMLYYRLRPVMPRSLQMALRRGYSKRQGELVFPAWPADDSLSWLRRLLLHCLCRAQRFEGIEHIGFWPAGNRFAVVLTHDVEQADGVARIPPLVELERRLGVRSSFNFVPERYPFDSAIIGQLRADGFEVGVHGLTHDGRLFESRRTFMKRATRINAYGSDWNASGFRSPACHRVYEWMKDGALRFDYDSSFPDTDPYQPMPGGCCSVFPWFLGASPEGMIELPVTMPQDHVLWEILGDESGTLWRNKADYIEARNGMALLIVHPDYLTTDHRVNEYENIIRYLQAKSGAWFCLPSVLSRWWRARHAAQLVAGENGHEIYHGPSAPPSGLEFEVRREQFASGRSS